MVPQPANIVEQSSDCREGADRKLASEPARLSEHRGGSRHRGAACHGDGGQRSAAMRFCNFEIVIVNDPDDESYSTLVSPSGRSWRRPAASSATPGSPGSSAPTATISPIWR
jgi:hypothetical protein